MTGTALSDKKYCEYPEYKDSGVEWLKALPIGWFISDLRRGISFLTDFEANGSFSDVKANVDLEAEEKYAWYLRATDLQNNRIGIVGSNRTIDEKAYKFLKKTPLFGGELLVAKRGEIGKVYLVPKLNCKATLAPNLYLIRLNKILLPKFALYWFLSDFGKPQLELANKSTTIGALYKDDVRACQTVYPTYEEQQKIANFLDHETAKIDSLIAKQEKLIELLKEKRQAVISHAVTRGLNPDTAMKDSGVEWLGEVPVHWELKKFKYLFKIRKRIAGELGHDILSITQKGIKVKDISSGDGQLSMDYSKYQLVYKGDFAMNHMDLLTGFVDISKYDGVTSPDYRAFTLEHKESSPEYYLNILQMGYLDKLFYPLGQGAAHIGRWRLPTEAFNEFVAPCPPKNEQIEITNFISETFNKIDDLLEKATKAVSLMKERKTALISAAVTGKIDVRDWIDG